MRDGADASPASRAAYVVAGATEALRLLLPEAFDRHVSVGLIGSCARGDVAACSDIDYCIVFDAEAPALDGVDLALTVERLCTSLRTRFLDEPFALRFSVFWSTLEDLRNGTYEGGRWPPYDRAAFRADGKYVAGMPIDKSSFAQVPPEALLADSIHFVLHEMRPRLEAMKFFERLDELSGLRVKALGSVLTSKLALMPVRVLYALSRDGERHPGASPEEAIRSCAASYGTMPWWTLVESAASWRRQETMSDDECELAARLLRAHAGKLYRCLLLESARVAAEGMLDRASVELEQWADELSDAPNAAR